MSSFEEFNGGGGLIFLAPPLARFFLILFDKEKPMGKIENDKSSGKLQKGAALTGKGILATLKVAWVSSRTIIAIVLICSIYFIPTGIAMIKGRQNSLAIFALNLFLGWSIIGWVVALVWALKSDKGMTVVIEQPKK